MINASNVIRALANRTSVSDKTVDSTVAPLNAPSDNPSGNPSEWDSTERNLTIEQWHNLAKTGAAPKMQIALQGDSMRPLIRRGIDPVTIVPITRPLRRGDVVLFEYPNGRYVVHRIWKLRGERVQTLGDNCWNPEPWLEQSCVWGLVREYERNGRTITLDSPLSRAFGVMWSGLLPVRRMYKRCRAFVGRVFRKLGLRR